MVVWNNDRVALCRLGEDYQVTGVRNVAAQDVRNVKWNRAKNRLGVLHATHLSIWSIDLQDIFRLFILRDGFYMLHVPYPAELVGDGQHHPGYFWSDHPDPLTLWEVSDAHDRVITDERLRGEYLRHYFSRIMIERAVSDYDRFVADLCGMRQPSSELPLCRRLLPG